MPLAYYWSSLRPAAISSSMVCCDFPSMAGGQDNPGYIPLSFLLLTLWSFQPYPGVKLVALDIDQFGGSSTISPFAITITIQHHFFTRCSPREDQTNSKPHIFPKRMPYKGAEKYVVFTCFHWQKVSTIYFIGIPWLVRDHRPPVAVR